MKLAINLFVALFPVIVTIIALLFAKYNRPVHPMFGLAQFVVFVFLVVGFIPHLTGNAIAAGTVLSGLAFFPVAFSKQLVSCYRTSKEVEEYYKEEDLFRDPLN